MGEIADMMLNGDLCAGCGIYLPGEGQGFPRHCRDCRHDSQRQSIPRTRALAVCPICKKRVALSGLPQHTRDKHKEPQ